MTQRRIYQDEYPYFITFRTREGYRLFEDGKMSDLLSKEIIMSARIKGYSILAWQIMPDHVHLLLNRTLEKVLSVGSKSSYIILERMLLSVRSHSNNIIHLNQYNISDLIQSIKGNFSRKLHMGNIWQRRFYTRIINTDKYLIAVINCIKQNPIKQDLSRKYSQQPYQYFDMKKIRNLF